MKRSGAKLFALAALGALATFIQVGPLAINAGADNPAPTVSKSPDTRLGPDGKPVPLGSGTITFALSGRYTYGAPASSATITEYFCNGRLGPESGSGPEDFAFGARGVLGGHTWFAFFSPKRTLIGFENVSRTPALNGGPVGNFTIDAKAAALGGSFSGSVSGTTKLSAPVGVPGGDGSVTAHLSCVRPEGGSNATGATSSQKSSSSSSGTVVAIALGIATLLAGLVVFNVMRKRTVQTKKPHGCPNALAELEAAEAEAKLLREWGDEHYRKLGALSIQGLLHTLDENRQIEHRENTEYRIAKATEASDKRLARAREALRICQAGGGDLGSVPAGFDPTPPGSDAPDADPTDRETIY